MTQRRFTIVQLSITILALCLVAGCGAPATVLPTQTPLAMPEPTQPPQPTQMPTPVPEPTRRPLPAPTREPAATANPAIEKYQTPGDYIEQISVQGHRRWFTVHLPPDYQPGIPVALVLNLHAYSSTAFEQEKLSEMNAKADAEGFVVVNPQALNDPPSWYGPLPGQQGEPDREFFKRLLPYLQRVLSVDPARIYATGMSNGGTMTYRLGCDMADTFAAIAPVSGGHVAHPLCKPERPVSVLVIHGTDDQVIPYHGNGSDSPPVSVWLEAWAAHNGCDDTPSVSHPYQEVTQQTWSKCAEDVEVALYTLEGGGHTWPGAPPGITSGASFPYMNATDVIWEFFRSHPRTPASGALSELVGP